MRLPEVVGRRSSFTRRWSFSALHLLRAVIGVSLSLTASCARTYHAVPRPFTANQLAARNTGEYLMTYLLQPNASGAVCDPGARGPHVQLFLRSDFEDVVDGLSRGVDAARWKQCVGLLIAKSQSEFSSMLFDEMGRAYKKLLRDSDLDKDPQRLARLDALHKIYLERPPGFGPHPDTMKSLASSLRSAVAGHHLSPQGMKYGTELIETLDIETGSYEGQPVTAATLDALYAQQNQDLLQKFSRRLPDPALRQEALRRMVRLRIAASPYKEVQAQAAEVERVVVDQGRNPISSANNAFVAGELKSALVSVKGVVVRQDVRRQAATLLAEEPGHEPRNMTDVTLRGPLSLTMQGISLPITLCGPKDGFDPSPCLPSSELVLKNPLVYLEDDGTLRFHEGITGQGVLAIAEMGQDFMTPIVIGGRPVGTLAWTLRFERPKDMVYAPAHHGAPGFGIVVDVDNHVPSRLVYQVTVAGGTGSAVGVVEVADAAAFHVAAAGGEGSSGESGRDGQEGPRGSDGRSASCPNSSGTSGSRGGDGTNGTAGGSGGPGGPGGFADARLRCEPARCESLARLVQATVIAPGGRGGSGGKGGHGGRGGRGGSGGRSAVCAEPNTTTAATYTVSGGSDGTSGSDGRDGPNGSDGRPGPPGRVTFRVTPTAPGPASRP